MIVVADASPLIFLGKLRQLDLVPKLLGRDIRITRQVYREVVGPGVDPVEKQVLESFLADCAVETVGRPRVFASAMSSADNAALTLALRRRADVLLCDERVTRTVAESEGIRSIGTLGVLLRARRDGLLDARETRRHVDQLISSHGFRIGIELYRAVLETLAE